MVCKYANHAKSGDWGKSKSAGRLKQDEPRPYSALSRCYHRGTMKIPRQYYAVVFAFFLTLVMVLIVTGVTTALNLGFPSDFLKRWFEAWLIAWIIAFPSAVFVAPWARRLAERLTG